ncbi:MAG: hypothetical protein K2M93_05000, partial [Muribaculaceae bacterium]|nr:hypothetical protein [Muribaculaceae bacterium]
MNIKGFILGLVGLGSMAICGYAVEEKTFWLGGDISGMTADEARGRFVKDTTGKVTETTRLMKDYGMNA